MNQKKGSDFIVFPLDFSTLSEAKKYIQILKGHVGLFKVGLELFVSEGPGVLEYLNEVSPGKVFLDLKFHDISATVLRAQRGADRYKVAFTTVHCSEGAVHLSAGIGEAANKVLGVTVLTSLAKSDLNESGLLPEFNNPEHLVLHRATVAKKAGCAGVVCSGHEVKKVKEMFGENFIVVTPGIRPSWVSIPGDDQARKVTPREAVENGADYIVVGRPIRDAGDPVLACRKIAQEIEGV